MFEDTDDPFLTADEAAKVLRMAKRTLGNQRSQKTGPKFRRHGGRIVYRLSDLLAWSEQRAAKAPLRPDKKWSSSTEEDLRSSGSPPRSRVAEDCRSDAPLER